MSFTYKPPQKKKYSIYSLIPDPIEKLLPWKKKNKKKVLSDPVLKLQSWKTKKD